MWVCYACMVYGLLPALSYFHPAQEAFLYWSNWIQLWSLPLIMVGTNILGRAAEERAEADHQKLADSYKRQQETYEQILSLIGKDDLLMAELVNQDAVLTEQTDILRAGSPSARTPS